MLSLGTVFSDVEEEASPVRLSTTVQPFCDLAPCRIAKSLNVIFQKMGTFSENAGRTSNITLVTHLPPLIYSQFFCFW